MAAAEGEDLDALVRRVDPDRWLATRFVADRERRGDVIALYAFDHELARAGRVASNPLIAQIRLTWWREVLDEIFGDRTVRAHPAARALAAAVRRHDLPRAPLEAMIDARIDLLDRSQLSADDAEALADKIGGSTAALAGRILDPTSSEAAAREAGKRWGMLLLRRSGIVTDDDRSTLALGRLPKVTAAAFPAIAHVALVKRLRRGETPSPLGTRLILLWSVLRGRV